MLLEEGWKVNHKRVERIWRQEGLKVPKKQPKRGRLWLADGSCVRKRSERPNHVWTYDFVFERTHDGRPLRILTGNTPNPAGKRGEKDLDMDCFNHLASISDVR